MEKQHSTIRAADVLERAFKLIISLKASRHNNPLSVAVLDEVEAHLKDLRSVISGLEDNSLDGASASKLLKQLFWKLVKCVIILFNITHSCIFHLRFRILYIWKLEKLLKLFAKVRVSSKKNLLQNLILRPPIYLA